MSVLVSELALRLGLALRLALAYMHRDPWPLQ
jgi:hypothetical protein